MIEPEAIFARSQELLGQTGPLAGKRVVVCAGGTREPIDLVASWATAPPADGSRRRAEAKRRGADVTLVCRERGALPSRRRRSRLGADRCRPRARGARARRRGRVVMAAAVADYRPGNPEGGKRPKDQSVDDRARADRRRAGRAGRRRRNGQVLVGFAADAGERGLERARAKARQQATGTSSSTTTYLVPASGSSPTTTSSSSSLRRASAQSAGGARRNAQWLSSMKSRPCWEGTDGRASRWGEVRASRRRTTAALADAGHRQPSAGHPRARTRRCEFSVLCLLCGGSSDHRGLPGRGEDDSREGARALGRLLVLAAPVHAGPAPSDVTGVNVFNQRSNEFEFRPGPVFANMLLVDEINRASPKTQAALLECMQEQQVTVDGVSYQLAATVHGDGDAEPDRVRGHVPAARGRARPFHDANRDRLPAARRRGEDAHRARDATRRSTGSSASRARRRCSQRSRTPRRVYVEESLNRYIVAVLRHTRTDSRLYLGASPRAGIALLRVAKARALVAGRDYVQPDDVKAVAPTVLAHRLILAPEARSSGSRRRGARRATSSSARRSRSKSGRGRADRPRPLDPRPRRRHLPGRLGIRLGGALPDRRSGSCSPSRPRRSGFAS